MGLKSRDHKILIERFRPTDRLTTGEAARLLNVEPDTVLKWVKKGKLLATRTAGGHHRIPVSALITMLSGEHWERCWEYFGPGQTIGHACLSCPYFLRETGAPARVLVISSDASIVLDLDADLKIVRDAYEASLAVEEFRPAIAVVEHAPFWEQLAADLAADPRIPGVRVMLAVPPGDPLLAGAPPPGIAGVVVTPFRLADLRARRDSAPCRARS